MRLHLFIKSAALFVALSLLAFALDSSMGFRTLAKLLAGSTAVSIFFSLVYPEVRGVQKGDTVSIMKSGGNMMNFRIAKALHSARKKMPLRVRFEGGDEAYGTLEDHGGLFQLAACGHQIRGTNFMNGISITRDEMSHILVSVSAISLAFSIAYVGIGSLWKYPFDFLRFVVFSFVTIGTGFIFHEMGHKVVGIYYGAQARFVMWTQGLGLMLATSLLGFLFAAPGAVYIYGSHISRKENALISLVGPAINVGIALVFLFLHSQLPLFFSFAFFNTPLSIWKFGAQINVMLAFFNMIPAFPLDGSKVYDYSRLLWVASSFSVLVFGIYVFSFSIVFVWGIMLVLALLASRVLFGRRGG